MNHLKQGTSGVQFMPAWSDIQGLDCHLAAPIRQKLTIEVPRKVARSMGRVSLIAAQTACEAFQMSGLDQAGFNRDDMGIAYGSSFGSSDSLIAFGEVQSKNRVRGVSPTGYIKMMGHTAAINLSLFLKAKGRLIPTSSACASGGQALGYAYETIKQGIHPVMLAGSAEELSPAQTAVFDAFYAASHENETPHTAVRPFSANRSGLVIGEGGASFILEDRDHAIARGATIYAEIVGFATNMDGQHIIKQDPQRMTSVITSALNSANIPSSAIGYINAHASGSESDSIEARVIQQCFGNHTPVSSTKGHTGHTLGGCGAIESWLTIHMLNEGWFAPTLNLEKADPACNNINLIMREGLQQQCDYVMNNNFAFGGVNVSIVFKKHYL